jgi:DNA invertase Pin-like site-specific DNA recombinase
VTANGKMPLAYSYIRFSTTEQAKGDSLRRQTEAAAEWCERNNIRLDETTTLRDLGKSAYLGEHRTNPDRYALAAFLKMVEDGKVPRGSYLIIENLDRLSREEEVPACHLLTSILMQRIKVVQMKPSEILLTEKSNGWELMRAIMELSRGHGESARKSDMVGKAWRNKKAQARNAKPQERPIVTRNLPAWIEERAGKLVTKPAAAAAVARVFALSATGYGYRAMIRRLEQEGIAPFARAGHWTKSYIHKILSDRRVLGEYQPRIKRTGKADGDPIPDYFPAVVTEQEWLATRAEVNPRRPRLRTLQPLTPEQRQQVVRLLHKGKNLSAIARTLKIDRQKVYRVAQALARKAGQEHKSKPRQFVNLFAGLVKNARDGESYLVQTRDDEGGHRRVLINFSSLEGRSLGCAFPLPVFEQAILSCLREIDPHEILNGDAGPDETLVLAGEVQRVEQSITVLAAELEEHGESPTIFKRLREQEAKKRELDARLAEARQKAAHPLSESWGECQSLIDALENAADKDDARLRLRSALRRMVDSMVLLVVPRVKDRLAAVQIWFAGGKRHRDYVIWHRPVRGNHRVRIEARSMVVSLATALKLGDLDLRRPEHARRLQKSLERLDLTALT